VTLPGSSKLQIVFLLFAALPVLLVEPALGQSRSARVAVIRLGDSATANLVTRQIEQLIKPSNDSTEFAVIDSDQAQAAAHGVGYNGSLNMTLEEARNLASAIGCDFFVIGIAETLRRSPSNAPVYFESYASLFLVSGRSGKLVFWERQEFRRATAIEAEQALLSLLSASKTRERLHGTIRRIIEEERNFRATAIDRNAPVIELMPDAEASTGVRAPRPFRRPKPAYPDVAAHDRVEATVDVLVDIDANGKVGQIEIARWAGYGLDESVMNTVKQMDFFPAMREGVAIPMRVLLRYNFRKPPPQ
jgi:TonB family protein